MKKVSQLRQKLIPLVSFAFCSLINFYCLYIYYTEVTDKDLLHLAYVGFTTLFANALIGFTCFVDEESFSDLRHLLDYAQIVLPLPFITTELWQKHDVGPSEVAIIHALFGLSAFLFFALMEYRRQDLTDLALILSITSSAVVGLLFQNYFATLAAVVMAGAYFGVKRKETCGDMKTQMIFNYSMAVFSLVSLAAFEPKSWMPIPIFVI